MFYNIHAVLNFLLINFILNYKICNYHNII